MLREAGHTVRVWSPEPRNLGGVGLVKTGAGAVWSRTAAAHVRRLIREQGSEIVHCHNLFPVLSPAVLGAAADEGAAVVMTLHNYRLMCLPATFLRDDRICEDCLGRLPWRGVVHRCYRDSLLGSGVLAGALALHRGLGSFERVHLFLAVSNFLRDKHIEAGLPAERIIVKPNFVPPMPRRHGPGDYFLFLGRLSPEKGLATILQAHRSRHAKLLIAGDGPQRAALEHGCGAGVEWLGQVSGEQAATLLSRARAALFASRWYEGAPRGILEAYAAGVPVIASQIGGLSELVEDNVSGLLVNHDDTGAWSHALDRLSDDDETLRMGEEASRVWATRFSKQEGLRNLEAAYAITLGESDDHRADEA
jgi:glycosyltransferase involved in cell wall biosynthesis